METKKIKLAFFGAPDFAAKVLKEIIEDKDLPIELICVVTQPDKPVGRKQVVTPTPVKELAIQKNIPVFDNSKLEVLRQELKKVDLVLLYAFGEIIPKEILKSPRWGFWNIHPSLLPLYRGPSPITYPLFLGDKKTGVSLISMDERLDHGPIIAQETYNIQQNDTRNSLENRLSKIGYKLFKECIQLLLKGALHSTEQNHSLATNTRLLTKKDGYIPFSIFSKILKGDDLKMDDIPEIIKEYSTQYHRSLPDSEIANSYLSLFHAFSPWPGLWTVVPLPTGDKRLKIVHMEIKGEKLVITRVQLEGKKEVDLETFRRAYLI